MKRPVMALALVLALGSCGRERAAKTETDEAKLIRLRSEVLVACDSVTVADSAADARAQAVGRIQARTKYGTGSSSSLQELQDDLTEAKRALAEHQRLAQMDTGQLRAEARRQVTTRTRCDVARRSVSLFMAGR